MLRLMSLGDKKVTVLAQFVRRARHDQRSAWSPDSKRLAFVVSMEALSWPLSFEPFGKGFLLLRFALQGELSAAHSRGPRRRLGRDGQ